MQELRFVKSLRETGFPSIIISADVEYLTIEDATNPCSISRRPIGIGVTVFVPAIHFITDSVTSKIFPLLHPDHEQYLEADEFWSDPKMGDIIDRIRYDGDLSCSEMYIETVKSIKDFIKTEIANVNNISGTNFCNYAFVVGEIDDIACLQSIGINTNMLFGKYSHSTVVVRSMYQGSISTLDYKHNEHNIYAIARKFYPKLNANIKKFGRKIIGNFCKQKVTKATVLHDCEYDSLWNLVLYIAYQISMTTNRTITF